MVATLAGHGEPRLRLSGATGNAGHARNPLTPIRARLPSRTALYRPFGLGSPLVRLWSHQTLKWQRHPGPQHQGGV